MKLSVPLLCCLSLTAAGSALTLVPRVAHAQNVNAAAAQARFDRGRTLLTAGNFAGALEEFRAANELVGSPNTRLYMARCLREMNHLAEASVEFQRAAAEAADRAAQEPRYVATRDNARTEGNALQQRLGRVTVRVEQPAPPRLSITVNGVPLASAAWGLAAPVDPGTLLVLAVAPGHREFRRTVAVVAGQSLELPVRLERLPEPPAQPPVVAVVPQPALPPAPVVAVVPPPEVVVQRRVGGQARIAGAVILVAGVGAVGGFVGLSLAAQGRYNELSQQCGATGCSGDQVAGGVGLQTAGNALLVTGSVLTVLGVVLIAAGGPRVVEERRPAAMLRWAPRVATDGRTVNVGVGGGF